MPSNVTLPVERLAVRETMSGLKPMAETSSESMRGKRRGFNGTCSDVPLALAQASLTPFAPLPVEATGSLGSECPQLLRGVAFFALCGGCLALLLPSGRLAV